MTRWKRTVLLLSSILRFSPRTCTQAHGITAQGGGGVRPCGHAGSWRGEAAALGPTAQACELATQGGGGGWGRGRPDRHPTRPGRARSHHGRPVLASSWAGVAMSGHEAAMADVEGKAERRERGRRYPCCRWRRPPRQRNRCRWSLFHIAQGQHRN